MKNPLLIMLVFIVGCAPLQVRVTSDIAGVSGPVANFAAKHLPIDGCPSGTRAQAVGNASSYIHDNYGYYGYYQYYRHAPVVSELYDFVVVCLPQSHGYGP